MRFTWTCDRCAKPVADNQGYLLVDSGLALDRHWADAQRRASQEEPVRMSELVKELADAPPMAIWHVYHRACDPSPARADYWIDVERFRTLPDLLRWNAHLSQKNWINATDWHRFIERRLGD